MRNSRIVINTKDGNISNANSDLQNSEASLITQHDNSNSSSTIKNVLWYVSTQIIDSPKTDELNQTDLKVTTGRKTTHMIK